MENTICSRCGNNMVHMGISLSNKPLLWCEFCGCLQTFTPAKSDNIPMVEVNLSVLGLMVCASISNYKNKVWTEKTKEIQKNIENLSAKEYIQQTNQIKEERNYMITKMTTEDLKKVLKKEEIK